MAAPSHRPPPRESAPPAHRAERPGAADTAPPQGPDSDRRGPLAMVLAALAQVGGPVLASVLLHAAVFGILILAAIQHRTSAGLGQARSEVVINIPPPPAQPSEAPAPSPGGEPRPAPDTPPPQLQGLTTPSLASPPVLRSAAADAVAPGDLMRAEPADAGATFAGLGTRRAESVVYVVDASGAMVSSLKFILAELERSARGLSSAQKFAVVLFRDRPESGSRYELFVPPGGDPSRVMLAPASPTNKAALARWLLTVRPGGRSNPLDGLRCGLAFKPDVVFLLSRSIPRSAGEPGAGPGIWGRGRAETLAELDRLNPKGLNGQRRAVIKAIQFLEDDPTGTMQAIGAGHGDGQGSYTVLTLRALGVPG
ncbi:MAG: hypothetical protein WD749_11240 [Phycisphaerales bacterium]